MVFDEGQFLFPDYCIIMPEWQNIIRKCLALELTMANLGMDSPSSKALFVQLF